MQLLYTATYKETKLVIIGVTVPKLLGLFDIAVTLVLKYKPITTGVWEKDYECQ